MAQDQTVLPELLDSRTNFNKNLRLLTAIVSATEVMFSDIFVLTYYSKNNELVFLKFFIFLYPDQRKNSLQFGQNGIIFCLLGSPVQVCTLVNTLLSNDLFLGLQKLQNIV